MRRAKPLSSIFPSSCSRRGWRKGRLGSVLRRVIKPMALALLSVLAASAAAAPPQNADPALAPWFRSLLQPGTAMSCCALADCRPAEYRIKTDHYEVLLGGHWLAVPPDKILQRTDNPTGHAIVCWTPQRGIMCFVRATES
jgi:hypothetical protein